MVFGEALFARLCQLMNVWSETFLVDELGLLRYRWQTFDVTFKSFGIRQVPESTLFAQTIVDLSFSAGFPILRYTEYRFRAFKWQQCPTWIADNLWCWNLQIYCLLPCRLNSRPEANGCNMGLALGKNRVNVPLLQSESHTLLYTIFEYFWYTSVYIYDYRRITVCPEIWLTNESPESEDSPEGWRTPLSEVLCALQTAKFLPEWQVSALWLCTLENAHYIRDNLLRYVVRTSTTNLYDTIIHTLATSRVDTFNLKLRFVDERSVDKNSHHGKLIYIFLIFINN